MLERENYMNIQYITIQGWMVQELGLSGNELLCYALIYGFSQDGESVFSGSSKYVCDWLKISKPTCLAILKSLCEKGFVQKIEKIVNGCHLCDYKITLPVVKKFYQGGKEILPHNNIDNKEKEIYKEKETQNKNSFEQFWNQYPKDRAGSKQKAYQSFCKAIKEKRTTVEGLLSAVKVYAKSDEVKRGFAKGCAAWLNDDRFNNNYGEIKKSFSEMTDAEKMACLRN